MRTDIAFRRPEQPKAADLMVCGFSVSEDRGQMLLSAGYTDRNVLFGSDPAKIVSKLARQPSCV